MARPQQDGPNYRLVQRGNYFYVRWWEGGTWHRVSTGTADSRQAARYLAQFVAGRGTPDAPDAPTVSAILTGYLADRRPRVASPVTLDACVKALTRHLGELQPDHVTKERARFYRARRRAEGHWVGPAGAKRNYVAATPCWLTYPF